MLTFAHPWVFWLFWLPLAVWWLAPVVVKAKPAVMVPFVDRVRASVAVGRTRNTIQRSVPVAVKVVVWLLILTALARPQWLEPPIERIVPTRDLLLAVDLSGSMEARDFVNASGESVDRLSAVKEVLGEFLSRREGDRVGLVVFGNAPFLQVPFTTDLNLCRQLLDETAVRMAGPRTAFGDAIGLGIKLFENSDAPAKTIIALTDGNDTSSAVPPAEAARVAADREIRIHTVAIGDASAVGEEALDVEALQTVARTTGGQFFFANDREELVRIYDALDAIEQREIKTVSHRPRRDLFHWPLLAALGVSLAAQILATVRSGRKGGDATRVPRVRVNTRTFELKIGHDEHVG